MSTIRALIQERKRIPKRHATETEDEGCRLMWCAVVYRAFLDAIGMTGNVGMPSGGRNFRTVQRKTISNQRRKYQLEAQTFILKEGGWYDEICAMLEINPSMIRTELQNFLGRKAA